MDRLFVFDIDGTLVNRSYELKQEVIDAINLLLDAGYHVATCSGRSFIGSNRFLIQFKQGNKYAICANGAMIYKSDKTLLKKYPLKYKDYLKTTKIVESKEDFFPYFYVDDYLFHIKYDECIELDKISNKTQSFNVENNFEDNTEIDKIMIRDKSREKMKDLKVPLSFKLKYSTVKSSKVFLEITHKKAKKGNGVEFLRKYLGVQKENVYVFGDSGNDVSMIKKFRNSIAMENGIPKVKKHAKYITKSVEECGVAYALKEILKVI
jgi:Cof subfamily protein (haloacid dehalogenase superfamily)